MLIADDPGGGLFSREALAAGGYQVVQAQNFIEAFDSSMIDLTPATLVVEVHRRLALRATLHATIAQAA